MMTSPFMEFESKEVEKCIPSNHLSNSIPWKVKVLSMTLPWIPHLSPLYRSFNGVHLTKKNKKIFICYANKQAFRHCLFTRIHGICVLRISIFSKKLSLRVDSWILLLGGQFENTKEAGTLRLFRWLNLKF